MQEQTRANRDIWDQVAALHYEKYHIERLAAGEPLLSTLMKAEVGDVRGKRLIHLLCHIGTDTLSWALLGALVAGVDISPQSIHFARRIAAETGITADFAVADVMDLLPDAQPDYDIVFASTGVTCWIPDIDRFAATVRALLKPGGFFYLHDGHPIMHALGQNEQGETIIQEDYFKKGAYAYDDFVDYTDESVAVVAPTYEWQWTLGDIVTALCRHNMQIEFLHEFPFFVYNGYSARDVDIDKPALHPCTFSIKAVAL
jgi:SAM-dependent methyltransferase